MNAKSSTIATKPAKARTRAARAELTPFRAALAALRAAERQMRELDAADTAACEAAETMERPVIPLPDVLTVTLGPVVIERDGERLEAEPVSFTYRTRLAIASDRLTPEHRAEMLEALTQHEAAQKAADDASGYTQAVEAYDAAHEAFMASYHAVLAAVGAVMRTPTRDPADIKVKRTLLKRYGDCEEDVVTFLRAMVDSLLDDAPPPSTPTPTKGAEDPTAAAYIALQQQVADYAHGLDASGGVGEDPADLADLAADAMLRTPPVDMAGVRTRLGRIINTAFMGKAQDIECPHCQHERQVIEAPTSAELIGAGEGQNGGEDAIFRALTALYQQVDTLAGGDPPPAPEAVEWFAARDALDQANAACAAIWAETDPEDFPALKAGVTEEQCAALCLARTEAQHRVAETTPPTVAEAAWKAGFVFSTFLYAAADPLEPGGLEFMHKAGINDGIMAHLYEDLVHLSGLAALKAGDLQKTQITAARSTPPQADAHRWEAAVAKYERARAAHKAASAESNAAHCRFMETGPAEIMEASLHYGIAPRWTHPESVLLDPLLSDRQREALAPLVEQHIAAQCEFWKTSSEVDGDELAEALYDAECDAEVELMATPAPDAAGLAFKSDMAFREADEDKFGFADLGRIAHMMQYEWGGGQTVRTHMDLLRLAGIDHPILHMEAFSPGAWIDEYEEAGGFVCDDGSALLLFPSDLPHKTALCDRMTDELAAPPWKYRAVQCAAQARRAQGGDPLFSASMKWGARDDRGSKPTPPRRPYQRVIRVIFETRDGAPSPIVQQWVNQGGELVLKAPAVAVAA